MKSPEHNPETGKWELRLHGQVLEFDHEDEAQDYINDCKQDWFEEE